LNEFVEIGDMLSHFCPLVRKITIACILPNKYNRDKKETGPVKRLIWVGSSHEDLKEFPPSVCNAIGYALFFAQTGKKHPHTKVLSEIGGAGIIEIRENDQSGTYRLIYTIEIEEYVFVLHAFQKKSKSGIATPKQEIEMIKNRLKAARALYKELMKRKK
jgi:phage-related protein